MATWGDLVAYVRASYDVIRDEDDELRVRISYDDRRAQVVVIAREVLDRKEEWVQIATPFARIDQVDLQEVLAEIGNTIVVGGAALMGEHLVLRHSLPLVNLDINEFVDPLELVTGSAELLEEQFTGRDDY
ncbi:hypothetical protein [Saccharomonospora xinjiangensis]|uniref:Bacterial sensory transduction regulator n=1 Tax=Saccharomonospora xinjiangensis XJ-54 TaxID=882086 RepID=I0UWQ2_9PSEU|nr:hypothetical protein [Saccharomonospora xinjiangensis]EID52305.1 hypothetical protein SacxiDRAFT_0016 [Saccharomonospora xinjiangensis XJ-54]